MERTNAPRRSLRLVGRLAACAASVALLCPAAAFADQLEQHNDLVNRFVNDMHADPLVADCAAHGSFVASTSTAFDHVEFPPSSFDSAHAAVTPWNDSFDQGKQKVKVENIVTVEGLGVPPSDNGDPMSLKFRCGYVGPQMLAFSWNDPVPPARRAASSSGNHTAKGKHAAKGSKKGTAKGSAKSRSGGKPVSHASSGGKSTKKASSKKKH